MMCHDHPAEPVAVLEPDRAPGPGPVVTPRRVRSERGAVGTEMAVLVALLVVAAIAVGAALANAAQNNAECVPTNPSGDTISGDC